MTSLVTFRCRICREPLGDVRDGALRPRTADVEIRRDGTAALHCPACGAERLWVARRAGGAVPSGRATG